MAERYITKTQFAALARVSLASVSKAKWILPALVKKRVDLEHPLIKHYIEYGEVMKPHEKGDPKSTKTNTRKSRAKEAALLTPHLTPKKPEKRVNKLKPGPKKPTRKVTPKKPKSLPNNVVQPERIDPDSATEIPASLEPFLDMTLDTLVQTYGTDIRFCDWLKAVQIIVGIEEKRVKNRKLKGDLISKRFVKDHVLSHIEEAHSRIINDSPQTIAGRAMEAVKAGDTKEQITIIVRKLLATQLRGTKGATHKALKNAI